MKDEILNYQHGTPFEGQYYRVTDEWKFKNAMESIKTAYKSNAWIEIQIRTPDSVTLKQKKSLHLYTDLIAQSLNDSGNEPRTFLKEKFFMFWTGHMVKEWLWKPVQKAMFGSKSTNNLKKDEVSKIYDVLNKHLCEKGIIVPFPEENDRYK
jgi:hypothetical protein